MSLREFILHLQQWTKYLFKNWLIILAVGLLGASAGFAYAFMQQPQYRASLSFVLEDSKSNSLGNYSSIASQFGIDLSGGGGSGIFTGDNILEFLKSRLMVEKTLLTADSLSKNSGSYADLYMQISEIGERLRNKNTLQHISFPPGSTNMTVTQDSVLQLLYEDIVKNRLVVSKLDKKLSFITVLCSTPNERFSKIFVETLVQKVTLFYISTKLQRSMSNVERLQARADSLEMLLNKKTYSVAASQDINQNPIRRIATVGTEVASRDKLVLQTMYGEVMKNLEISRMSMAQETPIIQIIDSPKYPLYKKKFGKLKGIIVGGVLAGLLILIYLIARKIFLDAINDNNGHPAIT